MKIIRICADFDKCNQIDGFCDVLSTKVKEG